MSDRITGITGDPEELARVGKAWHIYWQKVATGEDDYTMDHTASVLLIDRKGMYRNAIAYLEDSETALAKLRELVRY
jgi:protein SCO1/2